MTKKIKYIFHVSKLINVKNKKWRILYSVILSNLVVFFDLLIIFYFSSFFQKIELPNIYLLEQIYEYEFLFPFFIILRFLAVYLDVMNIQKFRFAIEEKLRSEALNDIFIRGNLSISDSYFYVNTLCTHISQFYQSFAMLLSATSKILSFFIYLLLFKLQIVKYFLIAIPILYFSTKFITSFNRKYSHISYNYSQEISKDLERVIDNLFLIKIVNKFKDEINMFKSNLSHYYSAQLNNQKSGLINSLYPSLATMLIFSIFLLFENMLKYFTIDLIAVFLRMFQSIGEANKFLSMTVATFIHLENLENFENNRKINNSRNYIKDLDLSEESVIKFQNVEFKYLNSTNYSFKNLNLEFQKNKHYRITGPNGSGKSTLLGLITGVLYPENGSVISNVKKQSYVSAYPMIINSTLFENLKYGMDSTFPEKKALDLLNKLKVFENENFDLNKKVSNKTLSSGQMQKIAFIRAILSNPEILILDEATSNLDSFSKEVIFKIIENLNLTLINSTHSLDDHHTYHVDLKIEKKNYNSVVIVKENESK